MLEYFDPHSLSYNVQQSSRSRLSVNLFGDGIFSDKVLNVDTLQLHLVYGLTWTNRDSPYQTVTYIVSVCCKATV